jgi:hypothetical protein
MRLVFLVVVLLGGCVRSAAPPPEIASAPPELALPPAMVEAVVRLEPGDPDFSRANLDAAVKPPGEGGVSEGLVVRLVEDRPVYRLWNGPERVDANGFTNRLGGWWAFDAPIGPREGYRERYEVCRAWNELAWVVTCTLRAGAVVVVGPGQSVSAETCGDETGVEQYAANPVDWQVYVDRAWARQPDELDCPAAEADYAADPEELSRALGGGDSSTP